MLKELPDIVAPSQVSTEPTVIGTNIELAVFSVLFFGFTSATFNEILKNFNKDITRSIEKIIPRLIKNIFRKSTRADSAPTRLEICRLMVHDNFFLLR